MAQTDFFRAQYRYKQLSRLLYGLLLIVIVLHIVVMVGFTLLIEWLFGNQMAWYHWFGAIVFPIFVFAIGSLLEWQHLKSGGRTIAKEVGAVRLFVDTSTEKMVVSRNVGYTSVGQTDEPSFDQKVHFTKWQIAVKDVNDFPKIYRRFIDFAEQLAIASGIQTPHLYVLPNEQGINAFVAGWQTSDTVLVVTQGAIEKLNDDALYGLIGHEYGHILHGDNRLNLKIMVMMAGLQWLYDVSDPIEERQVRRGGYFDRLDHLNANYMHPNFMSDGELHNTRLMDVDKNARKLEAQTMHLKTHDDWVSHWRRMNQQVHAPRQMDTLSNHASIRNDGLNQLELGSILGQSVGFLGMVCAQWLKHSIGRQRELLADATSRQLTRSDGIFATLKAIENDPFGARLQALPHIHGLSHVFFADAGTSLSDTILFATHPSISERLKAIDEGEFEAYAIEVARQARKRQSFAKQVAAQRRAGTWGALKPKVSKEHLNTPPIDFDHQKDKVVDGRLQVDQFQNELVEQRVGVILHPYQAKEHSHLPPKHEGKYIDSSHLQQLNLPQPIHERMHDPLGLLSVIESVVLCHTNKTIKPTQKFDLAQIWVDDNLNQFVGKDDDEARILPHQLNADLLEAVAKLDRRLDGALIVVSLKRLVDCRPNETIEDGETYRPNLKKTHERQKKIDIMLKRYHQGLQELLLTSLPNKPLYNKNSRACETGLWRHVYCYALIMTFEQISGIDIDNSDMEKILSDSSSNEVHLLMFMHALLLMQFHDPSEVTNQQKIQQGLLRLARVLDISPSIQNDFLGTVFKTTDENAPNSMSEVDHTNYFMGSNFLSQLTMLHQLTRSAKRSANQKQVISWLTSLHTVSLHDGVLSQDEYDVLCQLSHIWTGMRCLH